MKLKYKEPKPSRDDLCGITPSRFKTILKQMGFKVPRDFYKRGSVAKYKNRLYRFRWWSPHYMDEGFFIDVSEPISNFDRWANSVWKTITIEEFLKT